MKSRGSDNCRALKREVSARSLDRLIQIAESMEMIPIRKARRSTVHRALRAQDLSARRPKAASNDDLDRFEADFPNELWQSDMLEGPLLPDPEKKGRGRRCRSIESEERASESADQA